MKKLVMLSLALMAISCQVNAKKRTNVKRSADKSLIAVALKRAARVLAKSDITFSNVTKEEIDEYLDKLPAPVMAQVRGKRSPQEFKEKFTSTLYRLADLLDTHIAKVADTQDTLLADLPTDDAESTITRGGMMDRIDECLCGMTDAMSRNKLLCLCVMTLILINIV